MDHLVILLYMAIVSDIYPHSTHPAHQFTTTLQPSHYPYLTLSLTLTLTSTPSLLPDALI